VVRDAVVEQRHAIGCGADQRSGHGGARGQPHDQRLTTPSPNLFLTPIDVQGLGVILADQCRLAKRILEEYSVPEGREKELVTPMLAILIAMLPDEIAASDAHFPTTQQYQNAH
jgi:hypothetical protein